MGACFGVGHGYVGDALDGHGVVEGAIVAEDTAMAVGSVFAKADVGNDEEVWEGVAEEADGGDDGAGRVVGGCAEGVLCGGGERDAEKDYRAETFGDEAREEWYEAV